MTLDLLHNPEHPQNLGYARGLILLPNLLDESLSHEFFLPISVASAVRSLQGILAESEKSARRYLRRFLSHDEMVAIPIRLLNEHTKTDELAGLMEPILRGERWGILSDAGLPCLADPGAEIVWMAREHGIEVTALVGPSSIVLSLQLSGFSSQRFAFHGYLPREIPALQAALRDLEKRSRQEVATQIFIEAPYRSAKLLDTILGTLGSTTRLCVAASLTTPEQRVISQTILQWKAGKASMNLAKEPAVFLIHV
jgi:16S rRNA (cytidine1402-2'-O)-methyltransferase